MDRVVRIFLFSASLLRRPSRSFKFGGIEALASSGSHSSKMADAKLGKREGEALRAACMQADKKNRSKTEKVTGRRVIAARKSLEANIE